MKEGTGICVIICALALNSAGSSGKPIDYYLPNLYQGVCMADKLGKHGHANGKTPTGPAAPSSPWKKPKQQQNARIAAT